MALLRNRNLQHCDSQDSNASSSLSLPSEPPDIGNWFSSYEYKSPVLDSNVNFEDPPSEDCESEKDEEREGEEEGAEANLKSSRVRDEGVDGEKVLLSSAHVKDDKHNAHLSLPKGLDSFSVPVSEPPDVGNWFSSYIYESPDSGTSSLFSDSVSQETVCEEDNACFNVEDENKHEVRLRCENVRPRESIFALNTDSDTNTRVKPSSSMGDGSIEMMESNVFDNTYHLENIGRPFGKNWVHENDNREAKIQHLHEKLGNSKSSDNRLSERNQSCLGEKENGGDMMVPMNDFVTVRKKGNGGEKDENSWKKREDSRGRRTDSVSCKKECDMKRKALEEVTNNRKCIEMEVTGKWQCPQKVKPNLGPPLKQLRLERWVHRN